MNENNCGVVYALTGEKYLREAETSVRSLRKHHPTLPVAIMTVDTNESVDAVFGNIPAVYRIDCTETVAAMGVDMSNAHEISRALKVSTMQRSEFDYSLFLDSDTFIRKPISEIFTPFKVNSSPPELVLTNEPKAKYVSMPGQSRPTATMLSALSDPSYFNSGVFAFSKEVKNSGFSEAWKEKWIAQRTLKDKLEWSRLSDQGAL